MLKTENLQCGYGNSVIVKDLSIEVKQGDFTGIIGPNGSGKTTLIKAILKILKPFSGNILLDNKDIYSITGEEFAQKVSYLPSNIEIHFSYTVEEFIIMGRFPYTGRYGQYGRKDRDIVETAMRKFAIHGYRNRRLWELSDGEKQMVFLAQAVVQQPDLLILDEPTSHLDIGHQYKIMDIIRELNSQGLSIISVMHDLNLSAQYCSRLILIKDGSSFCTGTPETVLTYENIEKVYNTRVLVYENPLTGKPYVFGVPATLLKEPSSER